MARWKLMQPHYLVVDGEEWEYKETDRRTGKEKKVRIPVPKLLDPRDPSHWTKRWGFKDNQEGEIIVCMPGKGEADDEVFHGDPTPDMIPVDEEAEKISASFSGRWAYKPDVASMDYSQSLVDKFQTEMAELKAKVTPTDNGLGELTKALVTLVEQNKAMMESLATSARRI